MVDRVLPSTTSDPPLFSRDSLTWSGPKVTTQSTFLEVLVTSEPHLLIHCGLYSSPTLSAILPPGTGTSICLPLASIITLAESMAAEARTRAVPLPCRPVKPWPRMVSRVLLKVQVMVRSSITHSPMVRSAPWWETFIGSERCSRLRSCSGSWIWKESPLLALALRASQANFSLRISSTLTEVLSGSSTPLALEATSDRPETAIDGLLAARACVGRTARSVATSATSATRAPAARAGVPCTLGIGMEDTGNLSEDF